jgi:hypothetical protein
MLGLQAECESWFIDNASLAGNRAIQVIPAVELDSGLIRKHFEDSPGGWLIDFGRLS